MIENMDIEDIVSGIKENYVLYESKDFPLANGGRFYTLYFRDKTYNDSKQLRLWGDVEWNSMKIGYQKK